MITLKIIMNFLQQLQVPILPNPECKEKYRQIGKLNLDAQFSDLALCAGYLEGGRDSCYGDSGETFSHSSGWHFKFKILDIFSNLRRAPNVTSAHRRKVPILSDWYYCIWNRMRSGKHCRNVHQCSRIYRLDRWKSEVEKIIGKSFSEKFVMKMKTTIIKLKWIGRKTHRSWGSQIQMNMFCTFLCLYNPSRTIFKIRTWGKDSCSIVIYTLRCRLLSECWVESNSLLPKLGKKPNFCP